MHVSHWLAPSQGRREPRKDSTEMLREVGQSDRSDLGLSEQVKLIHSHG